MTFVFRQSRLFLLRRETLRVHEDRVEHAKPGLLARNRTVTIRFEQVAEIALDRRMLWSSLSVETTGGGGFTIHGLPRRQGDVAKRELETRIADKHERESLSEALDRLGRLRAEGLLTEHEFVAAKRAVFRRAA
ncbi:MAG TPA: hypothetical protein VF101_09530 [Gaiellaceae bacterium]